MKTKNKPIMNAADIPPAANIYNAQKGDGPEVLKLIIEANRLLRSAAHALRLRRPQSVQAFLGMAWAYATAAAWLRCSDAGDFEKHPKRTIGELQRIATKYGFELDVNIKPKRKKKE